MNSCHRPRAWSRTFLGKSMLWWLNFGILQWFFVRLASCSDDSITHTGWALMAGVVPMTGWGRNYIMLPFYRLIMLTRSNAHRAHR